MRHPVPVFAFLAAGLAAWAALSVEPALAQTSTRPAYDEAVAKQAYRDNCARCHGATGAGDGRDAARMYPRPRVLSEGLFKFRTTASGTPPTDEDLYHTISEGLPGSRMPEFQRLSEETRWQLVEYVKSLSPIFREQKPEPLDLGIDPGPAKTNLGTGKKLYTQLGCNACHGNLGRGDGPSAATLVDQWGKPIRAADLTQGWKYRSGSAPSDVLTRLMTGLDGTPMPSYAEAVSAAEVWDLAYYVHSLQVKPRWGRSLRAVQADGPLPAGADDPAWQKASRTDVRLSGLYYQSGEVVPVTVHAISIQAMYNESEIAFRLSWNDPTESRETPPDSLGLALLTDRRKKWIIGSLRSWPPAGMETPPELEINSWSAVDPMAAASYADGTWTVVVKQLRPPPAERPVLVGFMVWDGGNKEQGRHRSSSSWLDLEL